MSGMIDRELVLAGYVRRKRLTIPLSVAQRDGVTLMTMYPRTYVFSPLASYFYFVSNVNASFSVDVADSIVLPWILELPPTPASSYTVKLTNPIILQTDMPGTGHTLTYAEIQGQFIANWFTITKNDRTFKVDNDGTTDIWKVVDDQVVMSSGQFFKNQYGTSTSPLNIDLSAYSKINVEIHNLIDGIPFPGIGSFITWLKSPSITIMYTPTTPPQPASVTIRVTNRATGGVIGNALVQLLAGNVVVASGYTASNGTITLQNISGGITGISYTLSITAGGFIELTDSINVVPGINSFSYSLTPIPVTPTPSWLYPLIAVAGVGSAGAIGYGVLKGRGQGERPIIIER